MQKLILIVLFSLTTTAQALDLEMQAVVRTKRDKAGLENVMLTNLVSQTSFDGEHFMIVKSKGNCTPLIDQPKKEVCVDEAVRFSDTEEIVTKAATAYHHLTIARNYFLNHLKSKHVADLPKMIIRIEHTNQFSELGHFAHNNLDPQYNNALTVPGGVGLPTKGVKPWNLEIWFRPTKRVNINDLNVNDLQAKEFKVLMSGFRNQIHMQSLSRFLTSAAMSLITATSPNPFAVDNLIRTAGSSLVMEAGYVFLEPLTKITSRKWYWLDTAMVPEVIYHEYAHAALSDSLVLSHSTAIIEGMADFFAGQIANSPKLAKNIKEYNTFNGKNASRKQDYMIQFEMGEYANTDFVFGLLWELKKVVGEDKGEAFMFELRKHLTTNSNIRNGLVDGILQTCDKICEQPFNDRIRILKALNLRGI